MIVQQRGRALGTEVSWSVVVNNQRHAERIFLQIRSFIDDFEQRFSRFIPESEVSHINARAGEVIACSREFRELVEVAIEMQIYTDGLCSPLLLGEIQRAGYLGSWPTPDIQGRAPDYRQRKAHLGDHIILKGNSIKIPKNTALDFGGIGKGYALDKVADIIEANDIYDYWVSLGGDIIARGKDDEGKAWRILLEAIGGGMESVEANDDRTSVATSTVLKRHGKDWHHIIDPSTGRPAKTSVITASVVARTGVLADVVAKCLIIKGDEAEIFWDKHQQKNAYVMYQDDSVKEMV